MAVKSYLSRLLGIRHTTGAPSQIDCENLDVVNAGDFTATTVTASGAVSTGALTPTTVTASGAIQGTTITGTTTNTPKVASEARGDLLRYGASGWERVAAKTSGQIMVGDGTDIASVGVSGDVTLSSAGAVAIGSAKVLSAMVSPLLIKYYTASFTAAQASALNSAPQTLIAAAADNIHIVHRALVVLDYGTAAITVNGVIGLYETDATGAVLTGTLTLASFLGASADTVKELHPLAHSATTGLTRLANKAVVLAAATGDSTVGTSTSVVDVHLWYSTIPAGL